MVKKFTRTTFGWLATVLTIVLLALSLQRAHSQVLFSEGFDVVVPLPAGWAQQNLSAPVGLTNWFQGNNTVFPAQNGATTAYIGANFNNVGAAGTIISNWLFTPSVTLKDGDIFTFYTRSVTGSTFPDRLQVRMSTNGTSTNAGATSTSVGDFTTLLLDINPTYTVGGYPQVWTQYSVTVTGLGGVPTPGRLAFRYFVEDGGPNGNNSDYIGIDNVVYTTFGASCTGTPNPGNTISSAATVCPGAAFTLSLQNNPSVSGLTYQWQSSPDGTTWTNIAGATGSTLITQQNAATYYQAIVTCGAASNNSTPLQVPMSPATSCYCDAGATSTGFEKISNVTLNTINNNSSSTAGYENFTAISTSLEPGLPYPVSVSISNPFAPDQVIIWIDYNQNGSFTDAGEQVYTSALGVGPHSGTITVPFTALSGSTRMRVRMHDSSLGANSTSCGNSTYGQVEDYTVNILPVVPCSGTPNPGNTLSTVASVCSGTNFTLSLQNFTSGSGVTYQWQSSPDGTTWTDIAGATNVTYTTSLSATTFYQAIVTCGANSGTSVPVQVALNPPINCYCTPGTTDCDLDDVILNVTLNTLNNSSGCSPTNGYTNYAPTVAPTDVIRGATMPMSVTVGGGGTEYVAVWIDYNQNGVFEASEFTALGSANNAIVNGNIIIPATANLGLTGMRVRVRWNTALTGGQACLAYTFGETEDYLVNIIPCVQGVINTQPVNSSIACGGTTSFSVTATGSLLTYQWEYRTSASSPWQLVSNGGAYSGATTATLTVSPTIDMSGYQFRALISGACTAPDVSNAVTLTVTPYIANVNPASATICLNDIQQLSITNTLGNLITLSEGFDVVSPLPAGWVAQNNSQPLGPTGWFQGQAATFPAFSGPADSYIAANYQNTDPVGIGTISNWLISPVQNIKNGDIVTFYSRIPPGTEWADRLELRLSTAGSSTNVGSTETSVGDFTTLLLSINPSLSLNVYPKVWTQFTATVSGLAAPTSGRIAFRYFVTSAGGNGTNSNFIGIDDVRYISTGALASGVWDGPTGTIFTDVTATTPYISGTPANSVYVQPTTAGLNNYTVVVTTASCVSNVTTIPVSANTPVSNLADPEVVSTCIGNNAQFTTTAEGTGVTYQWQVSEDGGATWTNVINGVVYEGATSNTLDIIGAGNDLNGNLYRVVASVASCGSVATSAAAAFTVNPNPTITITSSQPNLVPGEFATLTANVSPNAGADYTWTLNGLSFTGGNQQQVVADIDMLGNYEVTVQDVNGCVGTSSVFNLAPRATEMAFIYPSPNTGHFQVRFYSAPGNVLPRMLNIFDSKGARVYSAAYPIGAPYMRMDVDLTKHGKGVYMVELADRNGNRIKAGRVVIL